jgi:hypothetical protein
MPTTDPVQVRLVNNPRAQLAGLATAAVVVSGLIVVLRWKRYGPYLATRTAKRLRVIAQRIEDFGLDIARKDAP